MGHASFFLGKIVLCSCNLHPIELSELQAFHEAAGAGMVLITAPFINLEADGNGASSAASCLAPSAS